MAKPSPSSSNQGCGVLPRSIGMAENIIEIKVDLVGAHGRFRKDFGDLNSLAASIAEIGLLQPIGIDSGNQLVFGERRLRAFKMLGRETIPARIVNLDSLIKGELAENDCRKDFTPSERVAIGAAIEAELRGRVGNPNLQSAIPENLPELPQGDTRDLVAKATGFGNGKTYEQAKKVVQEAAPELVEAMDKGEASVSAAAALLSAPKEVQAKVAQEGKKAIQQAAKQARTPKIELVKPAGTPLVLYVISAMDVLLRQMQREGMSAVQMADVFLDEVDTSSPAIADRIKATLPFMREIGRIAESMEVPA